MSFKALLSLVLLAVVAATAHPVLAQTVTPDGSLVQVGRYTTQAGAPTESLSDPLSVYAQLSYPRQTVNTVGEALAHTLVRTGFRLVPAEALEEAARNFLALPLPESQRRMGPHRERPAQDLAGSRLAIAQRSGEPPGLVHPLGFQGHPGASTAQTPGASHGGRTSR